MLTLFPILSSDFRGREFLCPLHVSRKRNVSFTLKNKQINKHYENNKFKQDLWVQQTKCWVFSRIILFIRYKILCGSYDYLYFTGEELERLAHSLPINPQLQLFHLTPWKVDHYLSQLGYYSKIS